MNLRLSSLILLAGLAYGCAQEAPEQEAMAEPTAEMSADEAAIEQVRADYVTHYNMHHADMVAAMFTDSAVFLSADRTVQEGREAIEASLTSAMAASPTLDLTTGDIAVVGDRAVARGGWTVTATPEGGEAMTTAGSYMSIFERADGAWKLMAVITNFSAQPPEGYPLGEPPAESPPENGTMGDLVSAYVEHFNAGHASMVADLFTDDGNFAFSNLPLAEGRQAIQSALEQRMAMGSPQLEIHDVATMELGDGWAVDAGWYRLAATTDQGDVVQTGSYVNLCQQQADGSWKIHWGVSNGVPMPAM